MNVNPGSVLSINQYMDEDMAALARQTADKLDAMHDADFEARQFHFTDE